MEKMLLANHLSIFRGVPCKPNRVESIQYRLNGVIIGHELYEATSLDEVRPIILAAGYLEEKLPSGYEDEPCVNFSKPGEFRCDTMANDPRWQDNDRSGIG